MSTETFPHAAPRIALGRLTALWPQAALGSILGLSALLDFLHLSRNGYANTYYSAAVKSMDASWHNFFFAALDRGGLESIDKPPLALWLQAISTKLFGFSSMSILAPEALAGVASVGVLYLLVARRFGRVAGLVGALALAVSPVSVAINRDNEPDALFVLLLLATCYLTVRAIESGRLRTLLGTAVLAALAFNTKMLLVAVIVPGIALGYLLFAPGSRARRAASAAVATVMFAVVSSAWLLAVQLTPAAERPWLGSTSDNSVLSLLFGYNGFGRIDGQTGGTSSSGGLGGAFSGSPGVTRLINHALGDQAGWLLPLAIAGGVSVAIAAVRSRRRADAGALVVIGGWFVTAAVIFSISAGIVHTYYVATLAPAIACLVGAGAVSLWSDARASGARLVAPLLALGASAWLEVVLLERSGYLPWLQDVVVFATIAAALLLLAPYLHASLEGRAWLAAVGIALGLGGLLLAPAAWSLTTLKGAVNGVFPGAGPSFVSGLSATDNSPFGGPGFGGLRIGGPGGGFGGTSSSDVAPALRYATAHAATTRFPLIVQTDEEAASSIIGGSKVASIGGFSGRETVFSTSRLASLVASGEARYFLLGGQTGFGSAAGTANTGISAIESVCTAIPASRWSTSSTGSATLYDCAGKATAIRIAR